MTIRRIELWRAVDILHALLLFLLLAAAILETGFYKREEQVQPLPRDTRDAVYVTRVGPSLPLRPLVSSGGDSQSGHRSDLRLFVNGEEWGPPHAAGTVIEAERTRAFSHWGDYVYFSKAEADRAMGALHLRVRYSVRIAEFPLTSIVLANIFVLALQIGGGLMKWRAPPLLARQIALISTGLLEAAVYGMAGFAVLFFCFSLAGVFSGIPIPFTQVFHTVHSARDLLAAEAQIPKAFLIFSLSGACVSWLAAATLVAPEVVRRSEARLKVALKWAGFPIMAALFLFGIAGGGWSGSVNAEDLNYMSLGSLVPYSDAFGYYQGAFNQLFTGKWSDVTTQRPLAGAGRQLLMSLVDYRYVPVIVLQVSLAALLMALAAQAIAGWIGIWAGIAFLGMTYGIARPFLPTLMTEPIGMMLALGSMIFFIDSFRRRTLGSALIAVMLLTAALLTRMGSLFTIPFLVLWVGLAFSSSAKEAGVNLVLGAGAVLSVFALSELLRALYGAHTTMVGGNFAHVLCGLAVGGDWSTCSQRFSAELRPLSSHEEITRYLVSKAWGSFQERPHIFFEKLWTNAMNFVRTQPVFFTEGYARTGVGDIRHHLLKVVILVPGLVYAFAYRQGVGLLFWSGLLLTVIASAALIHGDDGWRTLHVTHVLIAGFISLGFTAPGVLVSDSAPRWRPTQAGTAAVVAWALLYLFAPLISQQLFRREAAKHTSLTPSQDHTAVLLARQLTGFVVTADGAAHSASVPSMPYSQFERLMTLTRLEQEVGPFVRDQRDRVPFSFMANQFDSTSVLLIGPPYMLERKDVWAWRVRFAPLSFEMRSNNLGQVTYVEEIR